LKTLKGLKDWAHCFAVRFLAEGLVDGGAIEVGITLGFDAGFAVQFRVITQNHFRIRLIG
jgi:hypothetical protein